MSSPPPRWLTKLRRRALLVWREESCLEVVDDHRVISVQALRRLWESRPAARRRQAFPTGLTLADLASQRSLNLGGRSRRIADLSIAMVPGENRIWAVAGRSESVPINSTSLSSSTARRRNLNSQLGDRPRRARDKDLHPDQRLRAYCCWQASARSIFAVVSSAPYFAHLRPGMPEPDRNSPLAFGSELESEAQRLAVAGRGKRLAIYCLCPLRIG